MIFCFIGPTASGKTQLAIELVQRFPFEIISVDSAMVYRGLDIGTAKPSTDLLQIAPHRLIDIRNPNEIYSVGNFYRDVWLHIEDILSNGRFPLLVGGTMMYFHVLQYGIANLPAANSQIRSVLQKRADEEGWQSLHEELIKIDTVAAERIKPHDKQRLQRALEVYYLTGRPISSFQREDKPHTKYPLHQLALVPDDRAWLHQRIEKRFDTMLEQGFIQEVEVLARETGFNRELPSLRSVGYREALAYLAEELSYEEMREKSIIATRQLAKRQLTWLRTFKNISYIFADKDNVLSQVCQWVETKT